RDLLRGNGLSVMYPFPFFAASDEFPGNRPERVGCFCARAEVFSRNSPVLTSRMDHQETRIMSTNGKLNRKLRMALVGGGQGAFIGRVHATAAVLDNRAALVAGALSSDPAKAKASAPDYDIAPDRAYGSYTELIEKEKALPADKRI